MLRIGLITAPVIVIGFFVGATFHSAIAVAWSYLITNIIICLPEMKVAGDCIGLKVGTMLSSLKKTSVSAAVMGAAVYGLGRLAGSLPSMVTLLIQVAAGVVIYLGMAWLLRDPAMLDAREIFGERLVRLKAKLSPKSAA
jgi:hypothetical protein